MPFPETERVIYKKNPLVEVICQLRFPTILRIDAQAPADFQDRIRSSYPNYQEPTNQQLTLPAGVPSQLGQLLRSTPHQFSSEDGSWTVSLSKDFLALITTKYRKWEEFKEQLAEPLKALLDTYQPSFFSRLGLRYRNIISRSDFSLGDEPWSNLLQAHIAGELSSPDDIPLSVEELHKNILVELKQHSAHVRVRHGLATKDENGTSEKVYFIDNDFYTEEKTEVKDAATALDYFNNQSHRLFRWCIRDTLHTAMEPATVT